MEAASSKILKSGGSRSLRIFPSAIAKAAALGEMVLRREVIWQFSDSFRCNGELPTSGVIETVRIESCARQRFWTVPRMRALGNNGVIHGSWRLKHGTTVSLTVSSGLGIPSDLKSGSRSDWNGPKTFMSDFGTQRNDSSGFNR